MNFIPQTFGSPHVRRPSVMPQCGLQSNWSQTRVREPVSVHAGSQTNLKAVTTAKQGQEIVSMEDPIVIPTAKSVQKTLQSRNLLKADQVQVLAGATTIKYGSAGLGSCNVVAGQSARNLLQAEVREKLAVLQSDRSRQSTLLKSLEDLLKADLEALQAGKPPPK